MSEVEGEDEALGLVVSVRVVNVRVGRVVLQCQSGLL